MAIPLRTQWTLVASGLVAHADHVLAGEECERLMALVEKEVDGDEYGEWMALVGDPEQLEARLEQLPAPPAESHAEILQEAWLMAVVDGERADVELSVLKSLGARLGVDPAELDAWCERWSAGQHEYAEVAVSTLAWVLGGGSAVPEDDRSGLEEFVHELPTTHEHRDTLVASGAEAREQKLVFALAEALARDARRDLLQRVGSAAGRSSAHEAAMGRVGELAEALGMSADELAELLDG